MPEQISKDPIRKYFWNEIQSRDRNALLAFVGGTGKCKSGSALSFAQGFDLDYHGKSRFSLDRVVFTAQDFVKLVTNETSHLPKGSVIIWDEVQVEGDSREFYSMRNKFLKYIFTTFRYKNFVVLLTTPDLGGFDVSMRKVMHGLFDMKGQTSDGKAAKAEFRFIDNSIYKPKPMYKFLRYYEKDEFGVWIKKKLISYVIPRPPSELETAYKAKKEIATNEWYSSFDKQLDFMYSVINKKISDNQKAQQQETAGGLSEQFVSYQTEVMKDPLAYLNAAQNKFIPLFIVEKLKLPEKTAKTLCMFLNEKLKKNELQVTPS